MQSFGGGKFLATDFLKFRLHFLAQNFAPSMQNRKLFRRENQNPQMFKTDPSQWFDRVP
jgi:hypothetical protein